MKKKSLESILKHLKPKRIECPGYNIDSEKQNQVDCFNLIKGYLDKNKKDGRKVVCNPITPKYLSTLVSYTKWNYRNIIFDNSKDNTAPNDNSSIKLFRTGAFTVLSLGDIDSLKNKNHLINQWIIKNEVDVLLLAHHGADNQVNVKDFFKAVSPKIIVCSSNYDNEYSHPRDNVRKRISNLDIPLKTTKNGDVIISATGDHLGNFSVQDLQTDSTAQRGIKVNYKSKRAIKANAIDKANQKFWDSLFND